MVQLAHLPSLQQISGVEVVGVADVNSAAAQRLAAAYNIPHVYESSQALVAGEPKLDGVVIVTPRMYHTETCLPVLERGIPVFMEKPLEATPEQGRVIVEAQRRSGAIMVIGYNNRYCPAYLTADAMLRSGELGETRYAHIHSFGGLWRAGAMMLDEISLEAEPLPPDAPPKGQSRDGKTFPPELEWVEGWIHEVNMARGTFRRGAISALRQQRRAAAGAGAIRAGARLLRGGAGESARHAVRLHHRCLLPRWPARFELRGAYAATPADGVEDFDPERRADPASGVPGVICRGNGALPALHHGP